LNVRLKKLLQTILFFSTGIIILYLVYYKYNQAYVADCALKGIAEQDCSLVRKVYEDFLMSDFRVLFLVLIIFMLSNLSRALRWNMLLETLGNKPSTVNSFFTIMLGYFTNLGLPRIGEFIRAATLARYENMKVDKVMGTVILDRIMDVVLMFVFILMALGFSSGLLINFLQENSDLRGKILGVVQNPLIIGLFLILIIGSVVFLRSKRFRNSTPGQKIWGFIKGLGDGLKSIWALENTWLFIFHSIFIWLMYFLMLYVGFFAFQPTSTLGLIPAIVVFTLGGIGFVIPSPGGMGTYHFMVSTGLLMYGVSGADGFSFANIMFFTIQIFANILFGLLALILLPIYNNRKVNA
jgi:uncharacterized protein (TIRG00374 family)